MKRYQVNFSFLNDAGGDNKTFKDVSVFTVNATNRFAARRQAKQQLRNWPKAKIINIIYLHDVDN